VAGWRKEFFMPLTVDGKRVLRNAISLLKVVVSEKRKEAQDAELTLAYLRALLGPDDSGCDSEDG